MKQREERLYLGDIITFCDHIAEYVIGVKKTEFLKNRMLQDALIRKLEITGEAVKNISSTTRRKYPEVPWKEIAGMRDKVIRPAT